jgi:hypothetical protein
LKVKNAPASEHFTANSFAPMTPSTSHLSTIHRRLDRLRQAVNMATQNSSNGKGLLDERT